MALNAVHNKRLESPELLLANLVETVQFLLDVSVFRNSVFFLFSGLHLLHSQVKAILSHGTRVNHYLIFSQPSFATFDSWLQTSLQEHSLLQFLTRDPTRLKSFYHDWAIINKPDLYQAFLDCLYVLATRDLDLLSNIHVFQVNQLEKKAYKMPANGIPVIPKCDKHYSTSAPTSNKFHGSSVEPSINSIHIHKLNALDLQSKQTQQKNENGIPIDTSTPSTSTSTSVVPEFSYGSPESAVNLSQDYHQLTKAYSPLTPVLDDETEVESTCSLSLSCSVPSAPKSFLESGFKVQPTAMGTFPLPQKGQSVASFLASLSDTAMPELDRQNAHFNVSEALISAFESAKVKKWNEEIKRTQNEEKLKVMFGEAASTSSAVVSTSRKSFNRRRNFIPRPLYSETESELDYARERPRPPFGLIRKKPRNLKLDSEGHTESLFSTTDVSPASSSEDVGSSSVSAEGIALTLLRSTKLKDDQLADASELKWLVTERDAPQALLPMPKTWSTSESDTDSLDKSMRLRGTADWAPPRAQIIFHEHPPPNLQAFLKKSKYVRCAGCGIRVENRYANTLRYCNYLGRYFCTGCHSLKKARLPQKILHKWDFSPYYVSNFSAQLLESLQSDPVYNVMAINSNLYRQRRMCNFKNMRIQLQFLAEYLRNCRSAAGLYEEFNKLPQYYSADVDLYSLEDLLSLRFGVGLPLKTKQLVMAGIDHVLKCQLCRQLGFHCEVCRKDDIIFPFQITRVSRCISCSTCYHLKCFNPALSECHKCLRLSHRRTSSVDLGIHWGNPNPTV